MKLSDRLLELNGKGEYPGDEEIHEAERLQEAHQLLGVIAAEFCTDPKSIVCFDRRIVERAIELTRP